MDRIDITEQELLDALQTALDVETEGALTGPEIARAWGCHPSTARKAIRRLKDAGRLEVVPVKREGLDGRMCSLRGYRLVPD